MILWPREHKKDGCVAVASTVSANSDDAMTEAWLAYHRRIGVSLFYVFVDGETRHRSTWSKHRSDVRVFGARELRSHHATSPSLSAPFLAPYVANATCGASKLFVKQTLNLELAIEAARQDGASWLLHIDQDELAYAKSPTSFNIREILFATPSDCDLVVFPNHEAVPESPTRSSTSTPFETMTLFKRNHKHVDARAYSRFVQMARRSNPNYFLAYANGKSAVRLSSPNVRPNGAHRFKTGLGSHEIITDEAAILHFPYESLDQARRRGERCDCASIDDDKCSMLPFDRELAHEVLKNPSTFSSWYERRVVESNRARKAMLLKAGLYIRIHEPMILLQSERRNRSLK